MKLKGALAVVLFRLFTIGVFVDGEEVLVSVTEGDSVTLMSGVTEIHDIYIEWRFKGIRAATISSGSYEISKDPDVPSKDRLQLDKQTGDLKISNIKTTDSGEYKVKIRSTKTSEKTFTVNVVSDVGVKPVSVLEGDSVTLLTNLTEIQRDDVIRWRFEQQESPIAEINIKAGFSNTYDVPDGRFRDRLQLDNQTGSLTITDISATHAGRYEVDIPSTSSRYTIHKTFSVTVRVTDAGTSLSVKEGDPVTLQINVTEIQNNELAVWMFGDINLAEINKTEELYNIYGGPDERFKGRLELDYQTGSLTITNTRNTDSGDYDLKISRSRFTINRRFTVTVTGSDVPSGSGLSTGKIVGIVAGVAVLLVVAGLLVAARAGRVILWCRHRYLQHCIRRNINTTRSERVIFDENGQNDKQQDTDNPANEGTKLNDL